MEDYSIVYSFLWNTSFKMFRYLFYWNKIALSSWEIYLASHTSGNRPCNYIQVAMIRIIVSSQFLTYSVLPVVYSLIGKILWNFSKLHVSIIKKYYSLSIFNWALRRSYQRRDLLGSCAKSCVRQILCSKIYTQMRLHSILHYIIYIKMQVALRCKWNLQFQNYIYNIFELYNY